MPDRSRKLVSCVLWAAAALAILPAAAHAYIGPGAGFALVSSFLTFIIAFATAFLALFTFPIRTAWRALKRKKPPRKAAAAKVVVLGLDGLDPAICERLMDAGELPHFSKLRESGSYHRLGTSTPAMSPVAWSSFATGADASRHGIFDFLSRDPKTYLPRLSSSTVYGEARFFKLGPWRIPTKKGGVRFLRKGESFWKTLGDYGVFSTVLRVPITFPPEKINGIILSGMDVPDLRGTMGSFTYFSQSESAVDIGGLVVRLSKNGKRIKTAIPGPQSPLDGKPIEIPMEITVSPKKQRAAIRVDGESFHLHEREYSPWVHLRFKAAANIKMNGIARFYITRLDGEFSMYMTPIHIDPERPAMPISHPSFYAMYLAKLFGPYATLGLAEDTWAVNERVLDEEGFLKQAYLFHDERKKMWFQALKKLRKGFVCCVFDLSDRVQHMCFRYLDEHHPANAGKDTTVYKEALYEMYRKMDELVGETLARIDPGAAFFVMSDHGFKTFKRGVNLNTWLYKQGYLVFKPGRVAGEYLDGVDWMKTKAYAVGLGGIYLNLKGRERQGFVERSEAQAIKDDIASRLVNITDEPSEARAINRVIDVEKEFTGPYRKDGPDLIVGFAEGYRVSWDCARGLVTPALIEDNVRSWSGDHCIDPSKVPGILFSNLKLARDNPTLMDLGPTVLDLFGIDTPGHMTGRTLL
jgi:predicted AlkP superfamily phosphohydrolase/phosphomutase